MPASAKLYMSKDKWENSDLVDMIHITVQKVFGYTEMPEVKMGNTGFGNHLFMHYNLKTGPGMVMIHKSDVGGIPALMIDMSARREKQKHLLKAIAQAYGGLLMENDMDGTIEEFQDPFCENEDFMIKNIQKGGSYYEVLNNRTNEDIDQLIDQLQKMKREVV